jgi:hypothetical protein
MPEQNLPKVQTATMIPTKVGAAVGSVILVSLTLLAMINVLQAMINLDADMSGLL